MKLYIVRHRRQSRWTKEDKFEYRIYTKPGAAKGAMTTSMNPDNYSHSTTLGATLWEVDTDDLTPIEERGDNNIQIEGQGSLF